MMRAVIIDDECYALEDLKFLLQEIGIAVIGAFTDAEEGFDFTVNAKPDILFLDIDMPEISGIMLALQIQTQLPAIPIVFASAYSEYALDAYKAYPLDYILKPVQKERLIKTLARLEPYPVIRRESDGKELGIKLFGKSEIVYGGRPIHFHTKKTIELLFYLLCNVGTPLKRDEIVRMLFGGADKNKGTNNLHVTMFRLRKDLITAGVRKEQLFIKEDYTVDIEDGICDFIDFHRFIARNTVIDKSNASQAEEVIQSLDGELLLTLDAEWIAEMREWVQVKAEALVINTADHYKAKAKVAKVEKLLNKLIELNPISEFGYRQLLDIYMETGQKLKYSYYYDKYLKLMRDELNCIPDPKYAKFIEKSK